MLNGIDHISLRDSAGLLNILTNQEGTITIRIDDLTGFGNSNYVFDVDTTGFNDAWSMISTAPSSNNGEGTSTNSGVDSAGHSIDK